MNEKVETFCCYAWEDQSLLLKLRDHLAPLEREGSLNIWHAQEISPGTEREEETNKYLNKAHLILLLISTDFLASESCHSKMERAMERYQCGEARVIPILLRPCNWQETALARLQALPNNAQAISEWRNKDRAWLVVTQGIEKVVKELRASLPMALSYQTQSMIDTTGLRSQDTSRVAQHDWDKAPDVPVFFGRTKELKSLEKWIIEDRCRLVAIVGMKGIGKTKLSVKLGKGGIGKTDLSLQLARGIQDKFDHVIWQRLLNAPRLSELLTHLIRFLSNQQEVTLPATANEQIARLLQYLQESRCLVILDNAEMLLQGGKHVGQYLPGYEEYGQLFEQIAETSHQSCLLLTSREKLPEIARLDSRTGFVRSLELRGLKVKESKKIFEVIGSFSGSEEDWKHLNVFYDGNPLALELVAHHIKEVFSGRISEFLREGQPIFNDLRELLDWHFNRLSDTHKEVMYWFAINREPISLSSLREDILSLRDKEQISSTLHSLQRLLPLEKSVNSFTLQPVLIEYMTERFVEQIVEELRNGEIHLFTTHALLKTSVSDYVREVQSRLVLQPISGKLLEIYRNQARLEERFKEILSLLRERFHLTPGYAGGNLLNLLCHLKVDLRGYNFSYLAVWQAYLRGLNAQEVNFAYADLAKSAFTDTFGSILCVAMSQDGMLLAAGTVTGEIRVWYAASGLPLQTFRGHNGWVRSVAFSPDGKTLVSGGYDWTARLWEVNSGQCLHTFLGHTSKIFSVAFSPDGRTLASASGDQTVRLWDVDSGQYLNTFLGHSQWVRSVTFSPDGRTLASGGDDRTVRLWDVGSGRLLHAFLDHSHWIYSVAFSLDGKILASGSGDQTVRLWKVSDGQCLHILHVHNQPVRSVAFSPDGKTLASGSDDQTIRLWDMDSGQCLDTLLGHSHWVRSVAFSPDGKTLASGSDDQTVRLWDVDSGQCLNTFLGYSHWVRSVTFSPDGKTLASGGDDQTVRLWDVNSGRSLYALQGHSYWIYSVAFSPDGKTLASGSGDQTARLWDVSNGRCLHTLQGHSYWVSEVAFSPDGKTLASASNHYMVRLWDVSSGTPLNTLKGPRHWFWSATFSPDRKTLASGGDDNMVRLWELSSERFRTLHGHSHWVYSVAFSPDGKTLASGSYDHTVRLWDVDSGNCLNVLQGHTEIVYAVTFSPDGKTLASGSYDHTVRLWDVDSGNCLNVLQGHTEIVYAVAFSPDGKILASGSGNGTINLWNSQTYKPLRTLKNDRPYERMNITQVKGLTEVQKAALWLLGAIEDKK